MKEIIDRLQALGPVISRICAISGTPGVSIGVLHHNEVIHTAGFGYRDVGQKLPSDENTIYHIASMSKAVTAAAVGILVDERYLDWDTPVSTLVPEFDHFNHTIREETNLVDLMSHRTGLATQNAFWWREFGRLAMPRVETMPFVSTLPQVSDFRSKWIYSNWGFAMAAVMIERASGISWGQFLKKKIFDPLHLQRTTTVRNPEVDNVAEGHMALSDSHCIQNKERPHVSDGQLTCGANGVQSSVSDLLVMYQAFLAANAEQSPSVTAAEHGNPFKQVHMLLAPHIALSDEPLSKQSYGLGWVRTVLPGSLGATGINGMHISAMPVVGRGSKPKLVYHHNGSLAAFLSSVILIPDTNSAIVVLTNSLANNDCADWIGQLILETLIDSPEKNDYEQLARESAKSSIYQWENIPNSLAKDRVSNTSSRPLSSYSGKYYNSARDWHMEIYQEQDQLYMCIQGDRQLSYLLKHHHYDSFSWVLSQDENARLGRWPVTSPEFYLLEFQTNGDIVTDVLWIFDADIPQGQTLAKEAPSHTHSTNDQKVLESL